MLGGEKIVTLLKGLSEERVVLLDPSQASKLPFALKGIVRLVDKDGNTLGLVLDRRTLEEIEEELAASSSEFLASLAESRKSGRIPGNDVKKKAGLK
jgi:hypothetical protein